MVYGEFAMLKGNKAGQKGSRSMLRVSLYSRRGDQSKETLAGDQREETEAMELQSATFPSLHGDPKVTNAVLRDSKPWVLNGSFIYE